MLSIGSLGRGLDQEDGWMGGLVAVGSVWVVCIVVCGRVLNREGETAEDVLKFH